MTFLGFEEETFHVREVTQPTIIKVTCDTALPDVQASGHLYYWYLMLSRAPIV